MRLLKKKTQIKLKKVKPHNQTKTKTNLVHADNIISFWGLMVLYLSWFLLTCFFHLW